MLSYSSKLLLWQCGLGMLFKILSLSGVIRGLLGRNWTFTTFRECLIIYIKIKFLIFSDGVITTWIASLPYFMRKFSLDFFIPRKGGILVHNSIIVSDTLRLPGFYHLCQIYTLFWWLSYKNWNIFLMKKACSATLFLSLKGEQSNYMPSWHTIFRLFTTKGAIFRLVRQFYTHKVVFNSFRRKYKI